MKKLRIILPLFLLLIAASGYAQPQRMRKDTGPGPGLEERKENIETMKIAFLTRKLDLNPEEAKKFWPVYNGFTDETKKLRKNRRENVRDAREDFDKMNDKEVEKLIDGEIVFRQQELDVMKKYHGQFKEVLPMKKVALLYKAEEDFKKELLERIKERRGERGRP